jgi:hypothetical protein
LNAVKTPVEDFSKYQGHIHHSLRRKCTAAHILLLFSGKEEQLFNSFLATLSLIERVCDETKQDLESIAKSRFFSEAKEKFHERVH